MNYFCCALVSVLSKFAYPLLDPCAGEFVHECACGVLVYLCALSINLALDYNVDSSTYCSK